MAKRESFLEFVRAKSTDKIPSWHVKNIETQIVLGTVQWFTGWKRFVFRALDAHYVFDSLFLREVADFIVAEMEKRK